MLPYTPLHHLLLGDAGRPLVLTSGNVSDEPIAFADDDALERLAGIADLFLVHDRPIADPHRRLGRARRARRGRRCCAARAATCRRPLALPVAGARPVLACGAELKSTFCLARAGARGSATTSATCATPRRCASFREGIAHFERLFDVAPRGRRPRPAPGVPVDGLRAGARRRRARRRAAPPRAPRRVPGRARRRPRRRSARSTTAPATAPTGRVWGGEILLGDLRGFERVGHLRPVPAARRRRGGARAVADGVRLARRRRGDPAPIPRAARARRAGRAGTPSRAWRAAGSRRRRRRAWAGCSTRSRRCAACGRS